MEQFNFTVNRKMEDGTYLDMTEHIRADNSTDAIATFKQRIVLLGIEYRGPVSFTVTPLYKYIIEGMVFDGSYGDWDQGYYETWARDLEEAHQWWNKYGLYHKGIDISVVQADGTKTTVYSSPTAQQLAEQQGTFSSSKND